jgi:TetR/AcrR family transcriptional regulator, fatty acid metabolism regulator protein
MNNGGPNTNTNRMNIKELCQVAGVSRSTVYQYLRSGLLHMPLKEGPTKLRYDETHLQRLQEVKHFREKKKLSISEIQKFFQVETPRQEDMENNAEDLKHVIVDKALELISMKGFAKTKISDIADALNMGKGTFYLYFKKKEELFLKCIERFSDVFLPKEKWDEIRKERDYLKRANIRMYYMLESFPDFMGIVGIVKLAIRGTDPELARRAMECFQVIIRPVAREMERAIRTGAIRELDNEFISFLMFGIGEAAGYWRMLRPDYPITEATEKIMDFIKYGIVPRNAERRESPDATTVQGTVGDLKGNRIQLQQIHINDQEELWGKMGGGTLYIDLQNIMSIEMKANAAEHLALVTMVSKETVQITVDGTTTLSGVSSFGRFSIPLSEVSLVTISLMQS